jgi:spermidine synthase
MIARRVFLLLYAASGAAALVYEVAWTRLLTLQLGHTVAAASTVLAAFMGGLALGAWLAGRRAVTTLRAYAVLEIVVAASALLLPVALAASAPALAWAYADGTAPARFAIVRVAISLALLGIPAAAMGATFPIATDWFARGARGRESIAVSAYEGSRSTQKLQSTPDPYAAGVLYAVNTAGAATGAVAAGFFLIPAIGLRATTWVGVALNLVASAGAWWLASQPTTRNATPAEPAKQDSKKHSLRALRASRSIVVVSHPAPVLACAAAALSGCAALIYEVAWTRLLALVIGPTTYAFATMAAAFISGLAIGSMLGARFARRTPRPAVWLPAMLVTAAIAASAAAWVTATRMPLVVAAQVADPDVAFTRVVITQAVGATLLLLPMSLALGATFPLALAVAAGGASTAGGDAARVYTANTIGAIAGALGAGFVLVPALGLRATFQTAAILGALGGAACLAVALRGPRTQDERRTTNDPRPTTHDPRPTTNDPRPRTILWPATVAIGAVAAILSFPPWDRELLASGAYKYAPYLGSDLFETVLRAGTLEYYKEGAASTVSVRRLTGTTSLAIDGKVDASNAGDMLTQRLLGLLPVLLHGHPQDICVIGLGSGVTVGSALAPGTVRHADVVEISPEVVEASRFFDRENGGALSKPGVRLIVGDGRSHLLLTPQRYDVIVSEPSNPWMSGVAALFTREFFEAARSRLKPDGLLCQWAHTYDISPQDLQSIVRTFGSVFPQGTMWLIGEGDLLLIGSADDQMTARLGRIAAATRLGATPQTLATVGVVEASAAFDLLSLFAGGPVELARYGDGALVQTDDRTALEYSAPRGIYGRSTNENGATIRGLSGELPVPVRTALAAGTDADWTSRGRMLLKSEGYGLAYDAFTRAIGINSRNADALAGLSEAAAGARRQAAEHDLLNALADREPTNAAVRVELSRVMAAGGDFDEAIRTATGALRLAPDDPHAGEQLASIVADAGDADRLEPLAQSLVARFPDRPDPHYYQASALFLRGRTEDALAAVHLVTDAHPNHARAQNLLGAACATLGRRDCAQAAFEASLKADPRDPSTYVNLGQFYLQSANPQAAANYFAEALTIDPASAAARSGMTQARALFAPRN